ncbi:MAG: hypothetical protein ACPIOQ_17785, partial [Promethearchaeia archaeon]
PTFLFPPNISFQAAPPPLRQPFLPASLFPNVGRVAFKAASPPLRQSFITSSIIDRPPMGI